MTMRQLETRVAELQSELDLARAQLAGQAEQSGFLQAQLDAEKKRAERAIKDLASVKRYARALLEVIRAAVPIEDS